MRISDWSSDVCSSDLKGTGVAAALMDWGIAWARERASILYLTVFTENDRAQAFYRRYGFTDVGRNAFRVGNHIDEDSFFRLDLSQRPSSPRRRWMSSRTAFSGAAAACRRALWRRSTAGQGRATRRRGLPSPARAHSNP